MTDESMSASASPAEFAAGPEPPGDIQGAAGQPPLQAAPLAEPDVKPRRGLLGFVTGGLLGRKSPPGDVRPAEAQAAPEAAPAEPAKPRQPLSARIVRVTPAWVIVTVGNSPWWLISLAVHALLILIASFIMIEKWVHNEVAEFAVTISNVPASTSIAELERPRDVVERKGIPKDEPGAPTEEPAIFFPGAKESDHNESADGEDYKQMKGDSKEFLSYLPGESGGFRGRQNSKDPGVYDTMGVGVGGGGGGRYGGRFGGRENLVARGGGTRATESAVLAGLRWLARHQAEDGHWGARSFHDQCGKIVKGSCNGPGHEEHDVGVTGLALLAFLGAGYTHLSRDVYDGINYGTVVRKGIQWLTSKQDDEGCVGPRQGHYMYSHAIATLALSEAYGLTGAALFKDNAQRSINFVIHAQNPYKAWRYAYRSRDNDTSVTGWCVMSLKSAELSGLETSGSAYEWARNWIDSVSNGGQVGYDRKPGSGGKGHSDVAMSAVGMLCRIFIDKNKQDTRLKAGAEYLTQSLPDWKHPNCYAWYYISLALFQYDGPDGPYWKKWNERMKETLVVNQRKQSDGCMNGSWDAVGPWGGHGGRVYTTAINTLTLEVYYRYANVFGTAGRKPEEPKK